MSPAEKSKRGNKRSRMLTDIVFPTMWPTLVARTSASSWRKVSSWNPWRRQSSSSSTIRIFELSQYIKLFPRVAVMQGNLSTIMHENFSLESASTTACTSKGLTSLSRRDWYALITFFLACFCVGKGDVPLVPHRNFERGTCGKVSGQAISRQKCAARIALAVLVAYFLLFSDFWGPIWVRDLDRTIRLDLLCLYVFLKAPGTLWVSKSSHFCEIPKKVITFLRITRTANFV